MTETNTITELRKATTSGVPYQAVAWGSGSIPTRHPPPVPCCRGPQLLPAPLSLRGGVGRQLLPPRTFRLRTTGRVVGPEKVLVVLKSPNPEEEFLQIVSNTKMKISAESIERFQMVLGKQQNAIHAGVEKSKTSRVRPWDDESSAVCPLPVSVHTLITSRLKLVSNLLNNLPHQVLPYTSCMLPAPRKMVTKRKSDQSLSFRSPFSDSHYLQGEI